MDNRVGSIDQPASMHFARPSFQEFIATSEVVAVVDEASTDHDNNGAAEV